MPIQENDQPRADHSIQWYVRCVEGALIDNNPGLFTSTMGRLEEHRKKIGLSNLTEWELMLGMLGHSITHKTDLGPELYIKGLQYMEKEDPVGYALEFFHTKLDNAVHVYSKPKFDRYTKIIEALNEILLPTKSLHPQA